MRILLALLILIACPLSAQEAGTAEGATENATTENTTLILHTTLGSITIELFEDKAPKSSANFLEYARAGHYDRTLFHRARSEEHTSELQSRRHLVCRRLPEKTT